MRSKLVSVISILLAVWPMHGWTQEQNLTIVVLEGDGAFNDIRRKVARNPVVQVHDAEGRPVAGAEVVFTLPTDGASGTFEGGGKTFMTKTDAAGRASTVGLRPNSLEGRYNTRVTATLAGRAGTILISQSNTLAGGPVRTQTGHSRTKIILILLVAGAAGGGIFAATHHWGGGSPAPPTATLSAGTVTVGGPR